MSETTKEYGVVCPKSHYLDNERPIYEAIFIHKMQEAFLENGWATTGEVTIRWANHWDDDDLMCCTLTSAVVVNDLA